MQNSQQCLSLCPPSSFPASSYCGLVKGFLGPALLSLIKRSCPFHVRSRDHVGRAWGGVKVRLSRCLHWLRGWALSLLSLSWNLLVFLEPNVCVPQNQGRPKALGTGSRVWITIRYLVSRRSPVVWALGWVDSHEEAHLLASGFPALAGSCPGFVVFPETGWNCSLAENESGFSSGKRLKALNWMNNSSSHLTNIF